MSIRGIVGSLSGSHRAFVSRPDRRKLLPRTGQLPSPPDSPRRLPRLFRRRPGFDNDCPEFLWGERPREPRCPVPNPSRPALGKNCADLEIDCPGTKDTCPDSMSRRPGRIRFCPDAQTFAPFVIAAAPIYRTPRQFCNLLPVSNLYKTAPSPVLSDTLPRRAERGTGWGF